MSAPKKLTDAQIRWARELMAKRMDMLRQAQMYPTLEKLAEELDVSPRYLREIVNNKARLEVVEVA